MTYQHSNPFTSTSIISPANPFFSLLQQNPFFQELHTVTPLTPALPFLCSPAIYQPEVPASSPRNLTPPLHLVEAGNPQEMPGDGSSHDLAHSYCRTDALDDPDKYSHWDRFIGDGLKLNSIIDTQMPVPSTCQIEPTNRTPPCGEGDLILSNKANAEVSLCNTNPACTLIVNALPHIEAEAKSMHCSTQKSDLNNFVPQNASESEFDSSLPLNSSTEFSELNALACPYPTLSNCTFNKDKVSTVSVRQINITPNAVSVSPATPELSAHSSELLDYLDLDKKSDLEKVKCSSSKRQTDDNTKGSVAIQMTSLPYCNFDILEASSVVRSESPRRVYNVQESESLPDGQGNFKADKEIGTEGGDVELIESAIKEGTCLDGYPETNPLGMSIPLGPTDSVLQGRLTMEKDSAGNPGCGSSDRREVSFVGEGFVIENLKAIVDSSSVDSSNMSLTKEEVRASPPNPFKESFIIDCLPETLGGLCEVDTPDSSRQTLVSAPSPGYVSHSLYKSVDSEQYLTCMSQHSSLAISQLCPVANLKSDTFQEAQPKSGSSQEALPTSYQPRRAVSELQQDAVKISQEAFPRNKHISEYDPSKPPVSLNFLPKSRSLQNILENYDIIKEAIRCTVTSESIQKIAPPVDTVINHDLLHKKIPDLSEMTREEEELVMLDPHTFMDNDICSAEPDHSHRVQCDGALGDLEIIPDFCQSTENVGDFVSEPTSSITQDLVTTDLLLENVFVAQHAVTHSVATSPVTHPVPRETWHMALCPDSIKASQISKETQATTTAASVPQGERLDSTLHCSTIQQLLREPSTLDRLTSGHDLLISSPLSLLDLSPLASSTPHVAVGINSLPLFPFPPPSAPAKLLPHNALAAASLPPVFASTHNPFPQEEHQVAGHLSR